MKSLNCKDGRLQQATTSPCQKVVVSVTCHALRSTEISKSQISNECPYSHSKHNPAIVRHEQKPSTVSMRIP